MAITIHCWNCDYEFQWFGDSLSYVDIDCLSCGQPLARRLEESSTSSSCAGCGSQFTKPPFVSYCPDCLQKDRLARERGYVITRKLNRGEYVTQKEADMITGSSICALCKHHLNAHFKLECHVTDCKCNGYEDLEDVSLVKQKGVGV